MWLSHVFVTFTSNQKMLDPVCFFGSLLQLERFLIETACSKKTQSKKSLQARIASDEEYEISFKSFLNSNYGMEYLNNILNI